MIFQNMRAEAKPKKGFIARWLDAKRQLISDQRDAEKEDAAEVLVMRSVATELLNTVVNGLSVAASDLNFDDDLSSCDPGLLSEMVSIMDDLKALKIRCHAASERLQAARITHKVKSERSYARRMAALRRELGVSIDAEEYGEEPEEVSVE